MIQRNSRRLAAVLWLMAWLTSFEPVVVKPAYATDASLPLVPLAQREGDVVQPPLPAALEPPVAIADMSAIGEQPAESVDAVFQDVLPELRLAVRPPAPASRTYPIVAPLTAPANADTSTANVPLPEKRLEQAVDVPPPASNPSGETSGAVEKELGAEPVGKVSEVVEPGLQDASDLESTMPSQPSGGAKPAVPMPRYVAALRQPIEQSLQLHIHQRLNSGSDSCWSMMHSFLGWGPATEIHIGGPRGQRTNAIRWVASNQSCAGRRLWYLEGDQIRGREGPGYQGHPGQFLAMLAQCNIDPSLELSAGNRQFTVEDLILSEQQTCTIETELTFKLIGLVHYLNTEATWQNARGEAWNIERVLAVELSQPVNGAACGGTHRLMAISYALEKRRQENRPMEGVWAQASQYIGDYHRYTMSLQNRDGSFSSDWFKRRADWGDVDRRIQTTGHMLEWLVFSLPQESLYDPRVARAANFLAQSLIQHRHRDWEIGPKGHTIRALRLYHERVFQGAELKVAPLAQRASQANDR
jgi:hypothetical protein